MIRSISQCRQGYSFYVSQCEFSFIIISNLSLTLESLFDFWFAELLTEYDINNYLKAEKFGMIRNCPRSFTYLFVDFKLFLNEFSCDPKKVQVLPRLVFNNSIEFRPNVTIRLLNNDANYSTNCLSSKKSNCTSVFHHLKKCLEIPPLNTLRLTHKLFCKQYYTILFV